MLYSFMESMMQSDKLSGFVLGPRGAQDHKSDCSCEFVGIVQVVWPTHVRDSAPPFISRRYLSARRLLRRTVYPPRSRACRAARSRTVSAV
jgi:hypothetical protein